ncbi:MAG: endonuclease domain-containing protein [bacterium]
MDPRIHNRKYFRPVRKDLRSNLTEEETILWSVLKGNRFACKFRRQHSVGKFIADFYCPAKKLIIELDGSQHLDNQEYDQERTEYFESLNIKVIRFWNNEVRQNLHGVLIKIQEELNM